MRSYFAHREDGLQSRVENCRNGQSQECFSPGRPRGLKGEMGGCWYVPYCKVSEELFISSQSMCTMSPTPCDLQIGPCCFTHSEFGRQSAKKTLIVYWYYMYMGMVLTQCSARVDGLAKRELTATEMTEHFENRPDFLYLRHVTYEKPIKRFEPAERSKQKSILVSI